ncbi:HAD-like domain-containing protein [Nemania serpens]|nr:HAD-like domain-containing protein [Nemania serpens]
MTPDTGTQDTGAHGTAVQGTAAQDTAAQVTGTQDTAAQAPPPPSAVARDTIVAPSPESGGVPDPTPEYLDVASYPPFLTPYPRDLLVVIDLNGTLIHRRGRSDFVERPYARSFLSYCLRTFTVVIWSAARPENVGLMCRQLTTQEEAKRLVAVWGRDMFGLSETDYYKRTQCYKRLTKLWNDPLVAASHPLAEKGQKWSQWNTVLVDDSMEKARSEPFNLIRVPEFKGNLRERNFVLPQVHDYLNDCSRQGNVSAYMKARPFQIRRGFTL